MQRIILIWAISLLSLSGYAQSPVYAIQENISYYADSVVKSDSYIKERCKLDIYYPKNKKNSSTIVWFHGGGLTAGNKEIPKALLEKGFIVIGVGYRLSPKAHVPAIIEDATAAVAWAFRNISNYGGNTRLIFISGHSAGAYLGSMLTLNKTYLAKYNIDANTIAELISFSGQAITHFTQRQDNGIRDTQPVIDKYAPLYFVRSDAPPVLLITGDRELEMLGRYEENAYLSRMMKLTGHKRTVLYELEGYGHNMVEPAMPLLIKEVNMRSKEIMNK